MGYEDPMGLGFKLEGANQLRALAARIKQAGDNDLRKELLRGLREAAKPLTVAAKQGALTELPKRGGLAKLVAQSKFSVRSRASPKGASVRVVATSVKGTSHDLASMNRGYLRHPVYGHRDRWVGQPIISGWWDRAMESQADEVTERIAEVLDDVAYKIISEV